MDTIFQKNAENYVIFWLYGMLRMENFFECKKVNFHACANLNIEYYDFSNDFWHLGTDKFIQIQENSKILIKTKPIYSKFC